MKIEIGEDNIIELKEVYNGIRLISNDGEIFAICMRDSGFEFSYNGNWYEAKNNQLINRVNIYEKSEENDGKRWIDAAIRVLRNPNNSKKEKMKRNEALTSKSNAHCSCGCTDSDCTT